MSGLLPEEVAEKVADTLDDAADRIESLGWQQSGGHGPNGEVCAVVACEGIDDITALDALAESIGGQEFATSGDGVIYVIRWNDTPGRTKQEVLDAFRAAAKQQRLRSP